MTYKSTFCLAFSRRKTKTKYSRVLRFYEILISLTKMQQFTTQIFHENTLAKVLSKYFFTYLFLIIPTSDAYTTGGPVQKHELTFSQNNSQIKGQSYTKNHVVNNIQSSLKHFIQPTSSFSYRRGNQTITAVNPAYLG